MEDEILVIAIVIAVSWPSSGNLPIISPLLIIKQTGIGDGGCCRVHRVKVEWRIA
jgi:hypothetical protein